MGPRRGTVLALGLGALLIAGAPRPALAAPVAWEQAVDELASPDPKVRTEAAKRLGASWPDGAMAAPVLMDVAAEDADASVRSAAARAIEALGAKALPVWARVLKAATGPKPKEFHEVAGELVRLGAKVNSTDLCAGLLWTMENGTAEAQAGVLMAVPLATERRHVHRTLHLLGLDLVLEDRMRRGGARPGEVAAAGLALLANVALRDRGGQEPNAASADLAAVATLLALLKDERPWIGRIAISVLGALGSPTPDVVKALTPKPTGREEADLGPWWAYPPVETAVVALGRMGPGARAVVPTIRDLAKQGAPGAIETLVRLGERKDLLPHDPTALMEALMKEKSPPSRELRAGMLRPFGKAADELALADASLAEPARAALWAILRADAASPPEDRVGIDLRGAMRALERMGPIDAEAEGWVARRVDAGELGVLWTAFLVVCASDPLARLPALFAPEDPLDPYLDDTWYEIGVRVGMAGTAPAEVRARTDLSEAFRVGLLRGYARAGTADPERFQHALQVLGDSAKSASTLAAGGVVKAIVGTFEMPKRGEIPLRTQSQLEIRLRAVDVVGAQGPAAKAAVPTLEALLQDADPRVRWRARRALRAVRPG